MNKTDFNVEIFLNNIDYYCKKKNIRIGELERMTGVSAGYFAKVRRHQGDKIPKMHIALAVSENLGVPLNILALVDHNAIMDDTSRHLIEYIAAMGRETSARRMRWKQVDPENDVLTLPGIKGQTIFNSRYSMALGEVVTTISIPNTDERGIIQKVYYSQTSESTYIYFIEGISLPGSFLSLDYLPRPEEHFLGLWLAKDEKMELIVLARLEESSPMYAALNSLKAPIEYAKTTVTDISPDVKNEIDNFLKKTAFFSGV